MLSRTAFLLAFCSGLATSFQPSTRTSTVAHHPKIHPASSLAVIKAEEIDFDFDVGQGGVRLAQESVIKLSGSIKHKPGSANAKVKNLLRYKALTNLDEADLPTNKEGCNLITTGRGKTVFKNPGETTHKEVTAGAHDAVIDSLNAAGSAMPYDRIVINFAGSEELQVLDVLAAAQLMVLDLDAATKSEISFNSISDSSIRPAESVFVTVVGLSEEAGDDETGELYFCDGKYLTVSEKDLVTDEV